MVMQKHTSSDLESESDKLTMSVITGNIIYNCSFNSHVGSGSDEQDFDPDFCIILRILSGDARVYDVREALVDSSICSEVESAV